MSLQFSDTTNKKGIMQELEMECGFNYGDITGNTNLLKAFTVGVNLALDDFWKIAIPASGKWQFDDSNYDNTNGGYPIIYTNLVSGQRDYPFTSDGSGNLILDIFKALVLPSASSTLYQEIYTVDQQTSNQGVDIAAESTATGVPYEYDKTANGIFLNPPSSYNATNGLKVLINREASYFTSDATTKKAGVPSIFHKYFVIKPALDYARRKSLASHNRLQEEVAKMEADIKYYFAGRERNVSRRMVPNRN